MIFTDNNDIFNNELFDNNSEILNDHFDDIWKELNNININQEESKHDRNNFKLFNLYNNELNNNELNLIKREIYELKQQNIKIFNIIEENKNKTKFSLNNHSSFIKYIENVLFNLISGKKLKYKRLK